MNLKITSERIIQQLKSWPESILRDIKVVCSIYESKTIGDKGEATQSTYELISPKDHFKKIIEKKTFYNRPRSLEKLVVI